SVASCRSWVNVAQASSIRVTRKPMSQASRTADSTHWSVSNPITIRYSTPRLRSTYSMLVEMNTLDDVLGMTISLGNGLSSSTTCASHEPLAQKMPDTL